MHADARKPSHASRLRAVLMTPLWLLQLLHVSKLSNRTPSSVAGC